MKPNDLPYQPLITDRILDQKRTNIWVPMGFGKSRATLKALDVLQFIDGHPALVLAPYRVAQSTWPDEARKWDDLSGISVTPVLGTPEERAAALRTDAPVYSINDENLDWLIERYAGKPWPFRTIIRDEATRFKGHRLKQGSKRSKAIGKLAFTQIDRWVNLTGTPSPNGLKDLWGQNWFIDQGARLGHSFDAFHQRWFSTYSDKRPTKNGKWTYSVPVTVPREGADIEIHARMADVCMSLDPKDWFDLKEPLIREIRVRLPPKARQHYREMEKKMFTELDGIGVEALNAAGKTIKCLAEGTEILARSGWKPIEHYTAGEEVWDGEVWVSACKLACNGFSEVVKCWGAFMTRDHKLLTTRGWAEAQDILDDESCHRFNRHDVRLPDSASTRREYVSGKRSEGTRHVASPMRMRERTGVHRPQPSQRKQGRPEVVRMSAQGNAVSGVGHARHDAPSGFSMLEQSTVEVQLSERQGLEKLRRPRHTRMPALAVFVSKFLGRYGLGLHSRIYDRACGQRRELREIKLPMGDDARAAQQHSVQRPHRNAKRTDDGGAGGARFRSALCNHTLSHVAGVARAQADHTAIKMKVYDLVNCGPNNRFAARGPNGVPFIAHNCLQLASGFLFTDGEGTYGEVHDVKLQALESIIEEAAGASVLVSYWFKPTLARLQKAFPKGSVLDKDPQTIKDWNTGKIPLLFAHPMSAGHGLNMAEGGHIIAIYEAWWDLETYLQILERIGPVRQAQLGPCKEQVVMIYPIIAEDTIDEVVQERHRSKRSTQDLLMAYMKRKR